MDKQFNCTFLLRWLLCQRAVAPTIEVTKAKPPTTEGNHLHTRHIRKEYLKKYFFLICFFIGFICSPQIAQAGLPKCFGFPEHLGTGTSEVYYLAPNTSTIPTATVLGINQRVTAEGSAYRPFDQKQYAFQESGGVATQMVAIDLSTGAVTNVTSPVGTLNEHITAAEFATDYSNSKDYLWILTEGGANGRLYQLDPDTGFSIVAQHDVTGSLNPPEGLAWDPYNSIMYASTDRSSNDGLSSNQDLWLINLSNGQLTFLTESSIANDGEALAFAADGFLYTEDDQSSGPDYIGLISTSSGVFTNAGAVAAKVADIESMGCNGGERFDTGDAPSSYGEAWHRIPLFQVIPHPLYLGNTPGDDDQYTITSANADDDDNDGVDDEDGVFLGGTSTSLQGATFNANTSVTLDVVAKSASTPVTGYLQVWMDFNGNGNFNDPGEQIATNQALLTGNTGQVTFNVPAGAQTGASYIRVRYSTEQNLNSSDDLTAWLGEASDGEVEDYAVTISVDPSSFQCDATVDVWYANDESGSVNATEFTEARDFIYQVTDGFYHNSTNGAQGGLIGWAFDSTPVNVVIPITEDFYDMDDTGLATGGTTVDGDGLGVREAYTAKVSASSGTQLAWATQGLADLINAGNGRRTGVPQVAVILTDAPNTQINNVSGNGGGTAWEAAAANLRAAGPDGTRIVLILLAEAADAYVNDAASKATIDTVIGSAGFLVQTSTYANAADATNGYIDQAIDGICGAATFPVTDDYSDAPADGSVAPNGSSVTAYGDAIHTIDDNLKLGAVIDSESASIASANATGDGADDDGVSTFGSLTDSSQTYSVDTIVTNQTGTNARLIAWIDFDGNGTFDPDEAAVRSIPTGTTSGTITLNWSNIPPDIQMGDSFVRLRLTTEPTTNSEPNGAKSDGEVEDYPLTIVSGGATISGRVYIDVNSNAADDSGEAGISNTVVILHDIFSGTCRSMSTAGNGNYSFAGVPDGGYELYQAHGETTPVPQNCGTAFANNPTGYQSTTSDTLSVTVAGADSVDQDFGEVAGTHSPTSGNTGIGIAFEPDHQSEVLPGNTAFYAHTLTSEADGAVRFNTTDSGNTTSGWTHTLYRDNDCNGSLNGTEGDAPINGINLGIAAGGRLCVINKVYAPANVPAQDRYDVNTTAAFTYAGGTVPPATLTVTDITTSGQTAVPTTPTSPQVGESRLELTKTVENITQATPETEALNQAKPGDILKYRIYYRNTGTGPITDLAVDDMVPVYTGFVSGSNACDVTPAGMTCTPTINVDELNWSFSGSLSGGASGNVSYEVMVDN